MKNSAYALSALDRNAETRKGRELVHSVEKRRAEFFTRFRMMFP